jgi:hypothetical protein
MRSEELSREQLMAIIDAMQRYLSLTDAISQLPNDNPVWVTALEAQRATLKLVNELQRAEILGRSHLFTWPAAGTP